MKLTITRRSNTKFGGSELFITDDTHAINMYMTSTAYCIDNYEKQWKLIAEALDIANGKETRQ